MSEDFSELDHLSETIEREALISLHQNCPEQARRELGLELHEVADGLVAIARNDPTILLNRTLGLGLKEKVSSATLSEVRRLYANAGIAKPFIHIYEQTAPSPKEEGFELARGWRKFERPGVDVEVESRPCELRIERVTAEEGGLHFGKIVAPGFGMSDAAASLLSGLAADERWHVYVSYEGDQPAGGGAMMILGQSAWLEWGATSPNFRQRGSQGAIMRARLNAALEAHCTAMFTETGEAVEGDPQHSYRNIERYGFVAGKLRQNWRPGQS